MKCYVRETDTEFILCVEDVEPEYKENILSAWFEETDNGFIKSYKKQGGADVEWYKNADDKERIKKNFATLGESMFKGCSDWQTALLTFAQKCQSRQIEWYIFGSVSEAVLGVNIKPRDIDIIIHTRDFYKVKDIFPNCVVEPFVDNKDTWLVRYFGRLCVEGVFVDIAADHKMNLENRQYAQVFWKGYEMLAVPLQERYQIELSGKNRAERIKAIEEYMKG